MAAWLKKSEQSSPQSENRTVALSRINTLLSEEKRKIDQCCLEIGKKYAEKHSMDYEEDFADWIKEIKASQQKLADYSIKAQIITGVITCTNPDCRHQAPKGSKYCNMCGSKLPEIEFDNYSLCSYCGCPVEKGQNLCTICSHPLENDNLVQCRNCGEFVKKENTYCPTCGKPLFDRNESNTHTTQICPNPTCQAVLSADLMYCTECGHKLK